MKTLTLFLSIIFNFTLLFSMEETHREKRFEINQEPEKVKIYKQKLFSNGTYSQVEFNPLTGALILNTYSSLGCCQTKEVNIVKEMQEQDILISKVCPIGFIELSSKKVLLLAFAKYQKKNDSLYYIPLNTSGEDNNQFRFFHSPLCKHKKLEFLKSNNQLMMNVILKSRADKSRVVAQAIVDENNFITSLKEIKRYESIKIKKEM